MVGERLKVLVADDEAPVRKVLCSFLERSGYELLEAENGREALDIYEAHGPDIVITDIRMPEMDGLDLLRAIKGRDPDACVAIVTGYGTEEVAIEAIRCGACNYFKKPFQASELVYAVGVLAELVRSRRDKKVDFEAITKESRTCRIGNDLAAVYPLIQELTRTLQRLPFDVESIQIALLEMITNAVEHGNLGISLEEKREALRNGTLYELYRARSGEVNNTEGGVEVRYEFTPSEVRYTITDGGNGFDWKSFPDSGDPKSIMEVSGRGILMTRLLMDDVTFNGEGNSVTITKRARRG